MDLLKDLYFNSDNKTPIYLQIANCILDNVKNGNIKNDAQLPSINVFSKEYKVSRDTVEKAYKVLKSRDIVVGTKGLGSFIKVNNQDVSKVKVLFLINKVSPYKLEVYNAFIKTLGEDYHIDFEIYHCNELLFLSLIEKNLNKYNYYVIMPHFKQLSSEDFNFKRKSKKLLEKIPRSNIILLDNNDMNIDGDIIEIFQDFENDIFNTLTDGLNEIKNYKRLNLIITEADTFPYLQKISKGFIKFCNEFSFDFKILNQIDENTNLNSWDLFIVIEDEDLVTLLDLLSDKKELVLGKNLGVISYNETPFKRLLDIAVISTDFKHMGETAAHMILNKLRGKIKNPFTLIKRNSI
ncbi:GntR family transcriptional regulator [Aestuariibaculum suncheonense]|uniref:GntR family transcriptional regulator n=1 Tax=Aestuariibaculum suncheonense TaxID=1028745 RepID=A0A8J6Q473_9FLAO|nr:winged helix-turn-helix domain-containing protein [Aestuariibaculum suncheonense]MBD0834758.1 GntR family transcriptional regulator [Aestuariibaculum suncheonense]